MSYADATLTLRKRDGQNERCPYCREGLDDSTLTCMECATALHIECWEDLSRCPTIACAGRPSSGERERAPPVVGRLRTRCLLCTGQEGLLLACTDCGTPMHPDCWDTLGYCPGSGCLGSLARELPRPAVTVTRRVQPDWVALKLLISSLVLCALLGGSLDAGLAPPWAVVVVFAVACLALVAAIVVRAARSRSA